MAFSPILKIRFQVILVVLSTCIFFISCSKEALEEDVSPITQPYQSTNELSKVQLDSLKSEGFLFPPNFDWCAYVPNLTGYYSCNDGGHYYIRHINNKIYWFGEHPNGYWSNVFKGTVNNKTIEGYFYDVPKGSIQGSGELTLHIGCFGLSLSKTNGPQFGGSQWTKTAKPALLPPPKATAAFGAVNDIDNLTGRWVGNDGAIYYVRELGNQIVWFSESNFAIGQPATANVVWGSRFGNQLWLDFVDIPKGGTYANDIFRGYVGGANYFYQVYGSFDRDYISSSQFWRY